MIYLLITEKYSFFMCGKLIRTIKGFTTDKVVAEGFSKQRCMFGFITYKYEKIKEYKAP